MRYLLFTLILFFADICFALEPNQVLVVANSDIAESVQLAEYYAAKRNVPSENILKLPLGTALSEQISRSGYETKIAAPIRNELINRSGSRLKCILTLYGVPIKIAAAVADANSQKQAALLNTLFSSKQAEFKQAVIELTELGRTEMVEPYSYESFAKTAKQLEQLFSDCQKRISYLDSQSDRANQYKNFIQLANVLGGAVYANTKAASLPAVDYKLNSAQQEVFRKAVITLQLAKQQNWTVEKKLSSNFYPSLQTVSGLSAVLAALQTDMEISKAAESYASVDSELSMVQHDSYSLYRWQKNDLQNMPLWLPSKTLMVSRIDAPSIAICKGLIDKAIWAEGNGLKGKAYIDTRGFKIPAKPNAGSYEYYDQRLLSLAELLQYRTDMDVVLDKKASVFIIASCPDTALYCGWYSVKKYVDAFTYSTGAIGWHIASFEAMDLRNAQSRNWCPAMLVDGITATLGAVNEPYLHSFPEPDMFFAELLDGKSLVEAFYRTKPFNSWQLVLIGDPLYVISLR